MRFEKVWRFSQRRPGKSGLNASAEKQAQIRFGRLRTVDPVFSATLHPEKQHEPVIRFTTEPRRLHQERSILAGMTFLVRNESSIVLGPDANGQAHQAMTTLCCRLTKREEKVHVIAAASLVLHLVSAQRRDVATK